MRHRVLGKLFIFYGIVLFLLLSCFNTIGIHQIRDKLITEKKAQLTIYSQYVNKQHFGTVVSTNSVYNLKSISRQIATADSILSTHTWILDGSGNLILDSADENYASQSEKVTDYQADYLENYYYVDHTLSPLINSPMLSVILPIASDLKISGYIVVHYPMESISHQLFQYTILGNALIGILFLILLVAIWFTWWISIRPTQKILAYITASNQGNLDTTLDLHVHDEYAKLQMELSYMEEKIKNLDNYQKNFIANVSHDFRSPLTSIKGYAEAMLDGTIPEELYAKYLDVIVFEVERLTKLTSNLLSLNQFEQGRHTLEITSFDINQTIKRTAASFEGTCMKKHIKLKLTFSEKETMVNADQARIQQVLYNLLDNAIKFSHKDSEIHIKTTEHRDKVAISVKDFGIGIPKDGLKKVWERFYKTDLSRGKDKKGTGLGLSITKEIITAHNENINVTSTEGAGTEFTFTLPLTTPNI